MEQLAKAECTNGARVIIEKPFGHDLPSAQTLNQILLRTFDEKAIFRIDHYLGKRPVHNVLFFRFAKAFAAIGGLLGLGTGALIGDQLQGQEMKHDEQQQRIEQDRREIERQKREIENLKRDLDY